MSRSALKFLVKAGVAPVHRLVRRATFCTNRTQERKRKPSSDVKFREMNITKDKDVIIKSSGKGCRCCN